MATYRIEPSTTAKIKNARNTSGKIGFAAKGYQNKLEAAVFETAAPQAG